MSAPAVGNKMPPIAILAGGLATRLRPITTTIPKSMVPVGGEPFVAHQLRSLAKQGITEVVMLCGYLGDQIQDFVGDGSTFGCHVQYSFDGDKLLGTGGALRRALPLLGDAFMVVYGDSFLSEPFGPVWQAFVGSRKPALMTVFHNENQWDKSNIEFRDGVIIRYDKTVQTPDMHYIDYGMGCIRTAALAQWPENEVFDLALFYRSLVEKRELAGYEVKERFYEIGSHAGLEETDVLLKRLASV